ncbi:hypothetical protein XA68_13014 [Ophiocordyceps unilateralis]|uniref:Uncharacterized protein n=1 Tax=Ophiocordyceps unilateralis TaxID=268505 RepID=A0A2A9PCD3_OPHUN|nr:hypothetical protein XA68_13014 [Ophiocordyceps unilateralis]
MMQSRQLLGFHTILTLHTRINNGGNDEKAYDTALVRPVAVQQIQSPLYYFCGSMVCAAGGSSRSCLAAPDCVASFRASTNRPMFHSSDRPLAAGKITTTEAMIWMIFQLFLSWLVLNVMLEGKDVWKHLLPVMIASFLYPFGKRPMARMLYIYPQYILAFTIAWPAVLGRAAISARHDSFANTTRHCLPICTTVFFWTLYLNTAYSYQDVVDDRKLNVNSFYNIAGRHTHALLVVLVSPILLDGSMDCGPDGAIASVRS